MFKTAPQLDTGGPLVRFSFEGRQMQALKGTSVAAALLANGEINFRDAVVSGTPRGPFCMMGACFECQVVIDGKPGRQACMTQVTQDMEVHRQRRPRGVP